MLDREQTWPQSDHRELGQKTVQASSGPLKIGILGARGFPSTYGGFETFVRHLAPYLVAAGHDVSVYCREKGDDIRPQGVRRIEVRGIDRKASSTLTYGFTSSVDALRRRFDVLLILNIANGYFLPLLRATRTKLVVNVDGLEWQRAKWSGMAREVFRHGGNLVAQFADELIVDSQSLNPIWNATFGRTGTFIPYGADVVRPLSSSRTAALGLESRRYILVVARLAPENNVDMILDSLKYFSPNTQIVIVGSANYRNPTAQRLARLSEQKKVIWLGHVRDQALLEELWNHCGVYLHGHSVGGTNPALLQALGAGAPTLALDTPFNKEVLMDDSRLFSRSPRDIARKAALLLDQPDLQEACSAWGRKRVADKYTWERCCASYLNLFESITASAPLPLVAQLTE